MKSEANLAARYREDRRAFIAAVAHAGADAISRVHPAKGPDGKPLFCDSAAFGPRGAARGLLLIGGPMDFLAPGFAPKARLVVVHALDPYTRAWGRAGSPPDWPGKTLAAIAIEELSRVKTLTALDMDGRAPRAALAAALPKVVLEFRELAQAEAQPAISAAIAAL